jgi:hypothetical protein
MSDRRNTVVEGGKQVGKGLVLAFGGSSDAGWGLGGT